MLAFVIVHPRYLAVSMENKKHQNRKSTNLFIVSCMIQRSIVHEWHPTFHISTSRQLSGHPHNTSKKSLESNCCYNLCFIEISFADVITTAAKNVILKN